MFSYIMQRLERSQDHARLLGHRSASRRLAIFLMEMASRHKGSKIIDIPITRQDIADYLGLTIETVSRTLSQFERDGLIRLPSARRICLSNMTALGDLAS